MIGSPILEMPPFPGARTKAIAFARDGRDPVSPDDARACLDAMAAARVGGTFWAAQPALDTERRLIARARDRDQADAMLAGARAEGVDGQLLFWLPDGVAAEPSIPAIAGACDPWHLIGHADAIWCDAADGFALLARAGNRRVRCFGEGPFAALVDGERTLLDAGTEWLIARAHYIDPFSGEACDALRAIELLAHWRALIDANRAIGAAAGFARWKRGTIAPLLWDGTTTHFVTADSAGDALAGTGALALWRSRTPAEIVARAEASGRPLIEVEDGFIRSAGLGADCVPPLSIVVDRLGAHFDPAQPSELERLIESADIGPETIARAEHLRDVIIASGLSKYGADATPLARPAGNRRHVLVTGQVEDDRSVLAGGGAVAGNLDLLRRVRACEPDAYILYKPHPDIEAGHRKGHVPASDVLAFADAIVADASIGALLDMVDHVHVLTSLAGFEALIRDTPVTTHGVPFYAGWGLTTDLGAVPARRTRQRSVAELLAATLMLYPRYLDPVTGLPCPAEILVHRLAAGTRPETTAIVALRRLQGAVRRRFGRMLAA